MPNLFGGTVLDILNILSRMFKDILIKLNHYEKMNANRQRALSFVYVVTLNL